MSGLSAELIMRASLARHIKEITAPSNAGGLASRWEQPEYQKLAGESEIENLRWSPGYAELGYSDAPARGILFADWNYFHRDIDTLLERAGYAIEWSDEWSTCEDCNRAVRISPDSYGWQPSYFMGDGWLKCRDCMMADSSAMEEYLESLENDPRTALNDHINPADYGYVQIEGNFENGWHPGQNDNPQAIYDRLKDKYDRLLFVIDSVGQFDTHFSIWTKQVSD